MSQSLQTAFLAVNAKKSFEKQLKTFSSGAEPYDPTTSIPSFTRKPSTSNEERDAYRKLLEQKESANNVEKLIASLSRNITTLDEDIQQAEEQQKNILELEAKEESQLQSVRHGYEIAIKGK